MKIRKLEPKEYQLSKEIFSIAFEFATNDDIEEFAEHISKYGCFDDSDTLQAFLVTVLYNVNFDGNAITMAGIGGVSCLPSYRKNGAIYNIFEYVLPLLYKQNICVSYLYPFSTSYYNKYGYTICGEKINYEFDIAAISKNCSVSVDDEFLLYRDGNYFEDIKSVYNNFSKDINMTVIRNDENYSQFKDKKNPPKDAFYTYILKNKTAKGVIAFSKTFENGERTMSCDCLWFEDMNSLKSILGFVKGFANFYSKIKFSLPSNIDISYLIKETALHEFKRELGNLGMARVICVKSILEKACYKGNGSFSVEVLDKFIPENNSVFCVNFGTETETTVFEDNEIIPDIIMDIDDFTALIFGRFEPNMIYNLESVIINNELDCFENIFYKKPNFIYDYF